MRPRHHLFISPRSYVILQAGQTLSAALPCPTPYSTPRNFGHGPLLQKSVFFGGLGKAQWDIDCLPNSPWLFALLFAMHLLMAESTGVHGKRLHEEDPFHVNKECTPRPVWSGQPWGQKHPSSKMAKGKWLPKFVRTGERRGFLLLLCVRLLFITWEAGVELKCRSNGSGTEKC